MILSYLKIIIIIIIIIIINDLKINFKLKCVLRIYEEASKHGKKASGSFQKMMSSGERSQGLMVSKALDYTRVLVEKRVYKHEVGRKT